MTPEDVQSWLDAYVAAWRSYDADAIGELFSDDASYAFHPYADPLVGRAAIVESWRDDLDPPDSWEAAHRPLLVEGERAITAGETRYANGDVYANLWELEVRQQPALHEVRRVVLEAPAGRGTARRPSPIALIKRSAVARHGPASPRASLPRHREPR